MGAGEPAKYVWQCTCGWSWTPPQDDPGNAGGVVAHKRQAEVKARPELHQVRLIDTETGEVITDRTGTRQARVDVWDRLGIGPVPSDRDLEQFGGTGKQGRKGTTVDGQPLSRRDALSVDAIRVNDSVIGGELHGVRFSFPPWLLAYCSMGMRVFTREDGTPYTWSGDGVGEYLTDVIRTFHEKMLPVLLGMDQELARTVEGERHLRAFAAFVRGLSGDEVRRLVLEAWAKTDPETFRAIREILGVDRDEGQGAEPVMTTMVTGGGEV